MSPSSKEAGSSQASRSAAFPIVAMGASAGGLDAFKKFMSAMPADSGMAFVLIPHLDPTHESLMAELLGKHTRMPVHEARHRTAVEPDQVYVIPPNRYLAIRNGVLELSHPPERRGLQTAIDFGLRSLAEDRKEKAIGVILSGTGSHGVSGLKEIKLAGGMVMVQDPASAEYDQMPRNAIATGLVDYVLTPQDMPDALVKYSKHPYLNGSVEALSPAEEAAQAVTRILAELRARTKYDFRCYRKNMVMRRVQRRMGLLHFERFEDYLTRLREDSEEIAALYKDLLIGVTAFFREPEAFKVLAERIIPDLVRHSDQPIRAWVCGCATGEEAYSLAMVLIEQFNTLKRHPNVQIFATDIDETSLEVARQGIYPGSIVGDLSPERLQRFFTRTDEHRYQVSKQVRDTIVFAPQNALTDPPFSKLDLISCRNLLIYLEPDVQSKLIQLFHFALKEHGYLMLGASESIGRAADLFEPVAKKWRVYTRVGVARPARLELPLMHPEGHEARRAGAATRLQPPVRGGELMHKALAHYAPAAVLINRSYEILSMQGPLVDYLEFPPGEPTRDLLALARQGLRTKIRVVCQQAIHDNAPATDATARVKRDGGYSPCVVIARALTEPKEARGLLLVVFRDRYETDRGSEPKPPAADESVVVRQIEDELKATREDLHSTIEEFENAHEELKASNEEVLSMNEELQSANEELESSKEELQSLNEELGTVNSQLQDKVDELDKANADLTSLLESTEIATLFLDTGLHIKRFTPGIAKLLNLRPGDVGRSIGDFTSHFHDETLLADGRRALEKLTSVEKHLRSFGGAWFIRRVFPYRAGGNRIEGLIITFTDITQLVEAKRLVDEGESYRRVIDHLPIAAMVFTQGTVHMNQAAEALTGYRQSELATPDQWFAALFGARKDEAYGIYEAQKHGSFHDSVVVTITRKDGAERTIEFSVALCDGDEIVVMQDVTEKQALQRRVLDIASEEQRRVGQELHDSVLQDLAGLGLLGDTLAAGLPEESPSRKLAAKLAGGLGHLNEQVRLLCEGLIPLEVDAGDLRAVLQGLLDNAAAAHGLTVSLDCPPMIGLDHHTARQIYRIAQEAVMNAIKHSQGSSLIIRLAESEGGMLKLQVGDDGIGVDLLPKHRLGLGLQIMNYRCSLMGGHLRISRGELGGTVVSCTVPRAGSGS